jgi:hypothetical protein
MADLAVRGSEVVLVLTELEKLEGLHRDVPVPVSSVVAVEVVEDALAALGSEPGIGVRVGTGIPGVLVIGTVWHGSTKSFVVVHHGHPRGIRITLRNAQFDELIIGSDNADSLATTVRSLL